MERSEENQNDDKLDDSLDEEEVESLPAPVHPMDDYLKYENELYDKGNSVNGRTFNRPFQYGITLVNPLLENTEKDPDLFFEDGNRQIDLIIAFEDNLEMNEARLSFEKNVRKIGLHMEFVDKKDSLDEKTHFLKIHAPNHILERNAEFLRIKPPIKSYIINYYGMDEDSRTIVEAGSEVSNTTKTLFDSQYIQPEPKIFLPGFTPSIVDKFVVKERSKDFTSTQRTQIVYQILSRVKYRDNCVEKRGIQRLVTKRCYSAVFPLHSGDFNYSDDRLNKKYMNERRLLFMEWAKIKNFYKNQPLWLIQQYFGVKVGLYFAWLGFYTELLIIPAIVGFGCFIFGAATVNSPLNNGSKEMCDPKIMGNVTMCKQCEESCQPWKLRDACLLSKLTYLFDNDATIFFSIFMSFWATTFLELWKRKQEILKWEWDLNDEDDSETEIRPEFLNTVKTTRIDPLTQKAEVYLPSSEKVLRIFLTSSIVLVLLIGILGVVFSILVFRMFLIVVLYTKTSSKFSKLIATLIAASLNALAIESGGIMFQYIARKLTNMEHPRTQSQYESSYTIKMFLFQFINYYSSLIYTAFFKGRFFTYPGDAKERTNVILKLKGETCDPPGCLYEVCILLFVYMIFRQVFMNVIELYLPQIKNGWRKYIYKHTATEIENATRKLKRWEADYQLEEMDRLHLYDEYIEMTIQYGFVTLFVAGLPLAPLLALVNNIFEIRLDAYKYTTLMRRPLEHRVQSIGIWYGILEGITYMSVVFNALVISLTTDFIPRMVYVFGYSSNGSLDGYTNFTLSQFRDVNATELSTVNHTCYYRAFRNPPDAENPYGTSRTWIHIFTARLAFIIIFEHLVYISNTFLSYIIPDVPYNLKTQINREKSLLREAQYEIENNRHRRTSSASTTGPYRRPSTVGQTIRKNGFGGVASRRGSQIFPEDDENYFIK